MAKRTFWIVAACILLAVAAACSGNSGNDSNETAAPETTSSSSSSTSSESESEKPAATETPQEPQEPYSFTIMMSNENYDYLRELQPDNALTAELERLTGVKVNYQFIEAADRNAQLALRVASNDLPDVTQLNSTGIMMPEVIDAVDGGAFLELNGLLEQYGQNILKAFPDDVWRGPHVSKDGKIYGFPKATGAPVTKVIYLRKDWLDKLGMGIPQTMDDYLAYFEAVKQTDFNGNGAHDEIPLAVSKELGYFNQAFEGYFGVFPGQWQWVDGAALPDLINPKMKELVAHWKMVYDKGYVNEDMFTATLADRYKRIKEEPTGVGAFVHDVMYAGDKGAYGNPALYTGQTGVEVAVTAGPLTPEGTKRFATMGTGYTNVNVIRADAERPEEIIKYYDWFYSGNPEVVRFSAYGVEGRNHTVVNGQVQFDAAAEINVAEAGIFQFALNGRDARLIEEVLSSDPRGDRVLAGMKETLEAADDRGMFKFMPLPPSIVANPQLGAGDGSLWADMFAKVVLGREPIDQAWDNFVAAWRAQGGDAAIREATEWYSQYN